MENGENRGLADKKGSEDRWAGLVSVIVCQFNFEALSLFSLSHTLRHLEFSWSILALGQERQRRKEEEKIKQGKAGSRNYKNILCWYQVACVLCLLDLACMVLHVVPLLIWHGFF